MKTQNPYSLRAYLSTHSALGSLTMSDALMTLIRPTYSYTGNRNSQLIQWGRRSLMTQLLLLSTDFFRFPKNLSGLLPCARFDERAVGYPFCVPVNSAAFSVGSPCSDLSIRSYYFI